MKRVIAIAAAFVLLLLLTSCSTLPKSYTSSSVTEPLVSADTVSSAAETAVHTFTLSYSSGDSLNPYAASTKNNLELCTLLYEGLTKLDKAMTPQYALASSIDTSAPLALTAVLRDEAVFSDGTAVVAADVVSSFSLAKASSYYSALLSNVQSASAAGSKTVVFQLYSADPNAAACLSFPIIKSGTAAAPVGSGLYQYVGGDTPALSVNPYYGVDSLIDVINLKDLPDGDAMLYGLKSGSISYFFDDLSDGEIPSTTSASINIPLNYMVFMGINQNRAALADAAVRQALSDTVNRSEIIASAFAGRAEAAVSPFNPVWAPASELTGFSTTENVTEAVAQLNKAGYNNTDGNPLTLELLVSKGNSFRHAAASLLVVQMAKAGITLTINELDYAEYILRLQNGEYDLYLGEIRLSADMNLRPLLSAGGSASYGVNMSGSSVQAYAEYLAGSRSLQQFTDAFVADAPFIPLCYRQGLAVYNRAVSNVTPTAFDVYYGISGWTVS